MFLLALIASISFACLFISLLALGIVLKHTYLSKENEKLTTSREAIIITGCDSGIGLELAKYFYSTTRYSIICGFLNKFESDGYKELEALDRQDSRLVPAQLDLRLAQDIDAIVKLINSLKDENKIDKIVALINNAGVMTFGEFDWLTWNHIQSQVNVNLVGTIRLTRAIVPFIIQSKGRIINVSSVNDTTVFPGLTIYSATKSAISTLSRGLGYELRKFSAHVITLRLGDFARLTNIMAGHATHRADMWNGMDSRKQDMYKDFFNQFNDHLMKNYGMTGPREFSDSNLFRDFRRALLSRNPPTTITCAPITFKIFYYVIEQIPVWAQYYLLDLLFHFAFRWKPPRVWDATIGDHRSTLSSGVSGDSPSIEPLISSSKL